MAVANVNAPHDHDYPSLDHIIIWLDKHIGQAGECQHLKKAFSSNLDPNAQTFTMLTDPQYDNLLRSHEAMPVLFAGVPFHLLAFDDPYRCYEAFERHRNKHIYFITSGTMGEHIIPMLVQNHPELFTKPITNEPYNSIYIFCGNIEYHSHWLGEVYEYIQAFNHEADLLARMTHDVAQYFVEQGQHHLELALVRYHWSKKVFDQYTKQGQRCTTDLDKVERRIAQIETILRPRVLIPDIIDENNEREDEQIGQPSN